MFRLVLAIFLLTPTLAFAQSQRNPCFINVNGGCTPVGTNDPLPVDATVTATANTVAKATAVAPTYVEGSTDSLSMDLNGGLRVSGSINAVSAATATATAPTYVEGTSNPLSQNLAGSLRTIVTSAIGLSQGSTTSGQTGSMIMGAVTTSAPSYTTAQTSPLSLNLDGGLRVTPSSAASWGVLAQNSATSGQTANLVMGAVTNSAPTYTPAQSSALSLTANGGGLRTDVTTINTNNVLTGNGATGTGSQRVTIANDSAARAVGGEGAVNAAAPSGAVMSGARSGANMVELTQASASVPINVSTATTTQLVALSGSTVIRVTSFDVIAGGSGSITFVYGTGTNCGTGTTSLTGAYPLTAQAGIAKGSGLGPVLIVPAGNALCVTTSAAVQMSGSVSYTQY